MSTRKFRLLTAVMSALVTIGGLSLAPARASADPATGNPAAIVARDSILSLLDTLYSAIKTTDVLGPAIPFTRIAPASTGGLDLQYVQDTYFKLIRTGTFSTMDALVSQLEATDQADPGKPTLITGCKAGQNSA